MHVSTKKLFEKHRARISTLKSLLRHPEKGCLGKNSGEGIHPYKDARLSNLCVQGSSILHVGLRYTAQWAFLEGPFSTMAGSPKTARWR